MVGERRTSVHTSLHVLVALEEVWCQKMSINYIFFSAPTFLVGWGRHSISFNGSQYLTFRASVLSTSYIIIVRPIFFQLSQSTDCFPLPRKIVMHNEMLSFCFYLLVHFCVVIILYFFIFCSFLSLELQL